MENNIINNIVNIDLVKIEQYIIKNINKGKKLRKKTKKKHINTKICRSVLFISDSSCDEGI